MTTIVCGKRAVISQQAAIPLPGILMSSTHKSGRVRTASLTAAAACPTAATTAKRGSSCSASRNSSNVGT